VPFSRPTLSTLRQQTAADIAAAQPGADPLLRFSNLGVLGQVLAAGLNGLYGYLDWIAKNAVPFTAVGEFLAGWGALKGLGYKAATQGAFTVTFPAAAGTSIPINTAISRGDGAQFLTTALASVSAGVIISPVQAVVAGAAGATAPGTVMTLAAPIAGVTSSGVAGAATAVGADVETEPAFRARVLAAFASPAQGGAAADYVSWALQATGVTRAWVAPLGNGAGTVIVYFMMDLVESAFGGFPQGTNGVATLETRDTAATGDQLALANFIYPLRPVTALVYADAPGANAIAMTLNGGAGWSTATKAAVQAAITAVLVSLGSPGGVYLPGGATSGIINLSAIETAIAGVAGTAGFVITAVSCSHGTVSPGGDGNIASSTGYLPTLGTVTFS
jgi:uncharacterized phage protein gp47/JayE